jgi:hypothetical protein
MTATLMDILMIIALGVLAGTGTGLFIGFIARKQKPDWADMENKDKITTILLIATCSAIFIALLAWFIFVYPVT